MTNQINTKKNKSCQQTTTKISNRKTAYQKFMRSAKWKTIKKNLFSIRGKQCEICGNKTVQVHHKHYNKPWGEELPEDLIILCGKHHQKAHGIIKEYPKETEVRELHEELHNVPWCFRMEYEKPKKYRPKKKKNLSKKQKKIIAKRKKKYWENGLEPVLFKDRVILRKR